MWNPGVAAVTAIVVCLLGTVSVAAAGEDDKLVLMHYMPWYETPEVSGQYNGHWTGWRKQHDPSKSTADGLPDIWSHYHPLIGLYDSSDPAVVECHLLQMALAGIDGVVADWYGIGRAADYPAIHRATKVLFDQAERLGMRFAVCYEDRTIEYMQKQGLVEASAHGRHLAEQFAWLDEHWFGRDGYVKVGGRPLVLNFGPIFVKDGDAWAQGLAAAEPRPALFALHHLWKGIGADGGFTWVHPAVWEGEPGRAEIDRRLDGTFRYPADNPEHVIVSAWPGFRDVYDNPHPVIEHRDGDTLRETLAAALRSESPIVQLVTWNDYGEGTMIEPTHEFGYLFLEIVREALAGARGGGVSNDDLRLPARLLELRRSGSVDGATLDAIARALAAGRVDRARRMIESAGG